MSASLGAVPPDDAPRALPSWIRVRPPAGHRYEAVRDLLDGLGLGTVCREARCPNLSECWGAGTATLMLLGTECTRRCSFCAVTTHWPHGRVDPTEPARVAEAASRWGLRYVVLTQVCRDDLPDGGASVLAETVRALRAAAPATRIELLVGDLAGDEGALGTLLESPPDVLGHNLETVRALSPSVRDPRASYDRSLALLASARRRGGPALVLKSSMMLGLGEPDNEVEQAMRDLRACGVDLLTFGQYLRPGPTYRPVARFVPPDDFERWKRRGLGLGFSGVEAGPLVRSSYHAQELFERAVQARGS